MSIVIVGAGMAGLLAARMLAARRPVVLERQDALPHNHSAVLRFRSPIVSEVTGIPFKKVSVVKAVVRWRNPVADSLAYSKKNLGVYRSDRSILRGDEVVERYIAPPDFIAKLAEGVDVRFGVAHDFPSHDSFVDGNYTISTIPMPSLMEVLRYPLPHPKFTWMPGVNARARVHGCDAYVSLAVPDPVLRFSRVSITGDELIVEFPGASHNYMTAHPGDSILEVLEALKLLGLPSSALVDPDAIEFVEQRYAKVAPIEEEERRKFIFWASTMQGRSFSLGRYATWRPGLLLDDLVHDVRVIEKLMTSKTMGYEAQRLELLAGGRG